LLLDNGAVPVRLISHRSIRAGDGGVSWSEARQ
jgi:hypothetical protein